MRTLLLCTALLLGLISSVSAQEEVPDSILQNTAQAMIESFISAASEAAGIASGELMECTRSFECIQLSETLRTHYYAMKIACESVTDGSVKERCDEMLKVNMGL